LTCQDTSKRIKKTNFRLKFNKTFDKIYRTFLSLALDIVKGLNDTPVSRYLSFELFKLIKSEFCKIKIIFEVGQVLEHSEMKKMSSIVVQDGNKTPY